METNKYIFGQIRAIPANVDETRTIEFIISSNTKDRHKTVLPVDKWQLDSFNANGIVGYQHNVYGGDLCNAPDPDSVIGIGKAWIEGDLLIGSVTFEPADVNPLAEKIFKKVKIGTLKATSVGFNPTAPAIWGVGEESERGSNPTMYFQGQELLEFSIVNIPSNPDALKRSMRDQSVNAIGYIYRQLSGEKSFSEIENMTVRQIINLLEKQNPKHGEKGISVKVEVEIDNTEEPLEIDPISDPELEPVTQEPGTRDSTESDQDIILISKSKLALTANS